MNSLIIFLIIIYSIGLGCILFNKNNIINVLIISELNLVTIAFICILLANDLDDVIGQILGLYILTFTAAESSIGLAIVILLYKKHLFAINVLRQLKG
uniref:NADH-ubiquinone oxidoreductase chain 4L n=1 Tax=Cavenderia fasciculata TaxID=261658 RepID=B2XXB0_CACFS|nr:NADH dehydrogenase subunit 4L [Cavenderia fasciculata]ABX45232.1 NADH dehydrogenase subunit 4L [Cavenderia fasciculata]